MAAQAYFNKKIVSYLIYFGIILFYEIGLHIYRRNLPAPRKRSAASAVPEWAVNAMREFLRNHQYRCQDAES